MVFVIYICRIIRKQGKEGDSKMFELKDILHASSIAVVGASANPDKMGHTLLNNIIEGGFEGDIYPINLKEESLLGHKCYKSISEVPGPVDVIVVCVPAGFVPDTLREAGEKGVKGAIIISGGFREIGNDELEKEVKEAAAQYGIRIIGPNCQGVNYTANRMCATWPVVKTQGAIGLVTQSGTIGAEIELLAEKDGIGVTCFAALGNKLDITEVDFIRFFVEDPNVRVIALNIEGIAEGSGFTDAVREAAKKKPVVILKPGRTDAGQVAVASHTKSIAGNDELFSVFCKKYGIIRVNDITEMYDCCKLAAMNDKPADNRLMVVTSSGGSGILATDTAAENGMELPALPESIAAAAAEVLPDQCVLRNPMDVTGDATAERYEIAAGPLCDHMDQFRFGTLMLIFGDPIPGAAQTAARVREKVECGVVVSYLGGGAVQEEEVRQMQADGIPAFPTPERAVKALSYYLQCAASADGQDQADSDAKAGQPLQAEAGQAPAGIIEEVKGKQSSLLEPDAMKLFADWGIPTPRCQLTKSVDEAVAFANEIGYPMVIKISSYDIIHKSDVGGVKTGIADEASLRAAYGAMLKTVQEKCPEAAIEGINVMQNLEAGVECIVGMTRDPQFGCAVMFGLGGIFVEVLRDVALQLAPITREEALAMIQKIKGSKLLTGWRGSAPCDLEAVADIIVKVAELSEANEEIRELDINPVFVYEDGAVIADARVLL